MKTLLAAVLACLTFSGCFYEERDHRGAYRSEEIVYDPVCGVEVHVNSPWRAEFEGRVYYFHDEECRSRFRERPHAFVGGRENRHRDAR